MCACVRARAPELQAMRAWVRMDPMSRAQPTPLTPLSPSGSDGTTGIKSNQVKSNDAGTDENKRWH